MRWRRFPIFGQKIFRSVDGRIFLYERKRFCLTHKFLKKILKKSENCPDSYLDLRKARSGFTTQTKGVVPLRVEGNERTVNNYISR